MAAQHNVSRSDTTPTAAVSPINGQTNKALPHSGAPCKGVRPAQDAVQLGRDATEEPRVLLNGPVLLPVCSRQRAPPMRQPRQSHMLICRVQRVSRTSVDKCLIENALWWVGCWVAMEPLAECFTPRAADGRPLVLTVFELPPADTERWARELCYARAPSPARALLWPHERCLAKQ